MTRLYTSICPECNNIGSLEVGSNGKTVCKYCGFILHDTKPDGFISSGETRSFSSGSVRDSDAGKAAMELLPMDLLMRVATWYKLGADKYGVDNWRLGQPQRKVVGSLLRHLTKYMMGQDDEDHLSAVIWNALCLMHVDENLRDTDLFDAFGVYK